MRTKSDKVIEAIAIASAAYFAGTAIYAAVKRRKEGKIKSIVSGVSGTITPTGNEKTTIREAYKKRKDNSGYVIFTDVAEPTERQVWCLDSYDSSYREYVLYNFADSSKEKWVKGDKVCYTGFYF